MTEETTRVGQTSAPRTAETDKASRVCSMSLQGWLTGPLGMAICCGVPVLVLLAISLFGLSLGAIASGAISLAAILACPVGMYLMMRIMNKKQQGRGCH